jgi:protocatechuate 3,4-dioxygenase beta subunit
MLDRATLTAMAAVAIWLATRTGDAAPPCSRAALPPPIVAAPVADYATVVTGAVLDPEGHGIAGARVLARVAEDEPWFGERAAITDATGHFELLGLPPGRYAFVALHADTPGGSSPILRLADSLDLDIIVSLRPILL